MESTATSVRPVRGRPFKPGNRAGANASPEAQKRKGRSRITNGHSLLPNVSGSSVWARIMKDTLSALAVHCAGADLMSETIRLLARRISVLEAELVHMEDGFAAVRM